MERAGAGWPQVAAYDQPLEHPAPLEHQETNIKWPSGTSVMEGWGWVAGCGGDGVRLLDVSQAQAWKAESCRFGFVFMRVVLKGKTSLHC